MNLPPPPTRAEAQAAYHRAESRGKIWTLFDIAILLLTPLVLNPKFLRENLTEALIIFGVATLPTVIGFAYAYAEKKKRVEDLRDDRQYGKLNKAEILSAIQEVRARMNLAPGEIQVYITNQKEVNAMALTFGVGSILKQFRAVHINRGALHALDRDELKTVIAHEFAHLVRYPQRHHQLLLLNLLSAGILGVALFSFTGEPFGGVLTIGIYFFLFRWFVGSIDREIEHLCDDVGAEVGGIEAALRAEYHVAHHAEAVSHGMTFILKKKLSGESLTTSEMNHLLETATPLNPVSKEELLNEIGRRFESQARKKESSFFAFFSSLITGTSIESRGELEDQLKSYETVMKTPKVALPETGHAPLSLPWFGKLIQAIQEQPDRVLVATPEDLSDHGLTHPGPRRRLLYLWESYCGHPSRDAM